MFTPTKPPILFFPREVFIFPSWGKYISLVREKVFGLLQVFYTSSKKLFTLHKSYLSCWFKAYYYCEEAFYLFTPLHAYAYLNCVKTREDMWRPEATLHTCNELYLWMLPYIREEWRLFSFFVFFISTICKSVLHKIYKILWKNWFCCYLCRYNIHK